MAGKREKGTRHRREVSGKPLLTKVRSDCRACASPHSEEINRRLLANEAVSSVLAWLAELGEPISQSALYRHRHKHIDVAEETKRILQARIDAAPPPAPSPREAYAPPVLTPAAEPPGMAPPRSQAVRDAALMVVASVDLLDEVAGLAKQVATQLVSNGALIDPSMAQATLWGACLKEMRESVVAKNEILNGKKVDANVVVAGGLAGLFAELERRDPVEGGA